MCGVGNKRLDNDQTPDPKPGKPLQTNRPYSEENILYSHIAKLDWDHTESLRYATGYPIYFFRQG